MNVLIDRLPFIIDKLFVTKYINSKGKYIIQFCNNGNWTNIKIDSFLPKTIYDEPILLHFDPHSNTSYSIDYNTHIDIVMWDCDDSSDYNPLSGCEQCTNEFNEVIPNLQYKKAKEMVYRYTPEFQFCRPTVAMFEENCIRDEFEFCPRGYAQEGNTADIERFKSLTSFSTYMCRSRPNGMELNEHGEFHMTQQGHMCVKAK